MADLSSTKPFPKVMKTGPKLPGFSVPFVSPVAAAFPASWLGAAGPDPEPCVGLCPQSARSRVMSLTCRVEAAPVTWATAVPFSWMMA